MCAVFKEVSMTRIIWYYIVTFKSFHGFNKKIQISQSEIIFLETKFSVLHLAAGIRNSYKILS